MTLEGKEQPLGQRWGRGPVEEKSEQHYARVGDQLVTVSAKLGDALTRSAEQWRSHAWSQVPTYDVDRLAIEDSEGKVAVSRSGADWLRGDEKIAYMPVSRLLSVSPTPTPTAVDAGRGQGVVDFDPRARPSR